MWLYRVNQALGPLLGAYWRLKLQGAVDSIPRSGPLLVASNHASFLDPWLVGMVFPRSIRFLMVRRWYDRSPLWRAFFRAYGTIPLHGRSQETLDAVTHLLARGEVVGVFPEGRISPDGKIQRFRPGLSQMAARSGAPVVPVGIRGNFDTLPKHGTFPRPTRVTIHVGEPRRFPGAPPAGFPSRQQSRQFLEEVFEDVCRLAGQRT